MSSYQSTFGAPPRPLTHQQRLARCRPVDRSAHQIAFVLDVYARPELELAQGRLASLRRQRESNLVYHTVEAVLATEAKIPQCEIEIAQLTLVVDQLVADLETAKTEEAEGEIRLQQLADAIREPAAKFRAWLENVYPKHARIIADGLKLEEPLEKALNALYAGFSAYPYSQRPPVPNTPSLNSEVNLPGANGGPAFAPETSSS